LAGTFIYLPDFEAFLRAHPSVGVVLSTSWREDHSLEELRSFFSPDLQNRIIGVTPVLAGGPGGRLKEILAWIVQHCFHGQWAALDDDATLFPAFCDRLVLCQTARGLRRAKLMELCTKLGLSSAG
jgi:hypothetical protein